jgi:hypothetical protein
LDPDDQLGWTKGLIGKCLTPRGKTLIYGSSFSIEALQLDRPSHPGLLGSGPKADLGAQLQRVLEDSYGNPDSIFIEFDEPKGGITAVPAKVLVDGSSRIRNPAKQSALP